MPLWIILTATAVYIFGLFAIAWRTDKAGSQLSSRQSGIVYALALTVYCTSWTFYGAVGTAVSSQWDYLWILLGPALVFTVMPFLHRHLAHIGQREGISSLSDFLSARYGKSGGLAALVAISAVAGSLPYIALQLKSVSDSLNVLTSNGDVISTVDSVLAISLAMALFAILFGARGSDVTQRNAGLMRVLAVEALIKLLALLAVAIFSFRLIQMDGASWISLSQNHFGLFEPTGRSAIILLISMTAILCLPRQFHVTVVERNHATDSKWAQWLLPLYLILIGVLVVPITVAGLSILPSDTPADTFVLSLPLANDAPLLGLLVFLGGISAATGMVIVATLTLSTMVANDLIVPFLLKRASTDEKKTEMTAGRLVFLRRSVIVFIMLMAYGYFRLAGSGPALASIGLLSFAAAAQFAPLLIGALFWQRANRMGAISGLMAGMIVWTYTLFAPALMGIELIQNAVPSILDPHALLGSNFGDSLTHGVIWSLSVNILIFVIGSLLTEERLRDRVQATAFLSRGTAVGNGTDFPKASLGENIHEDDLRALASRFLEPVAVNYAFEEFRRDAPEGGWARIRQTERLLSRAIGASSARVIMSSALSGREVRFDDVLRIFDQKSARRLFDDHNVQALLESLGEGISIVDSDQKLVAWNGTYIDIFDYPKGLLQVGTPIQDLIHHNIEHGWIKSDNPEDIAQRRVKAMKEGRPHLYERKNPDGRFLRIEGHPLPGGGYITTFRDVTEDRQREHELREMNENLELRVLDRTRDLQHLTQDLDAARKEAEAANQSKTRFLAAASHDLMQPLNAARLFLSAANNQGASSDAIVKAERAIQSADELLKGLLDISRLDQTHIEPRPSIFPLGPFLEDLVEEAEPMAADAGVEIRFVPTSLSVETDPTFLQSILRNFLSNARRYTLEGGVLIGARRDGDTVRIEVWDTGPGLTPEQQNSIFDEFARGTDADNRGIRGAGLGLSVVKRLSDLMQAPISVRSVVEKGSVFSVTVSRAETTRNWKAAPPGHQLTSKRDFSGLAVVCLDDEVANLDALKTLLSAWGCEVRTASNVKEAAEILHGVPETVLIADHNLRDKQTGLSFIQSRLAQGIPPSRNVLLTASRDASLEDQCRALGVGFLPKPADPKRLQDILAKAKQIAV